MAKMFNLYLPYLSSNLIFLIMHYNVHVIIIYWGCLSKASYEEGTHTL